MRPAEGRGPYGRIPEAAPFPAAGPMCSAENC